jgi:trehalose-phosphatase
VVRPAVGARISPDHLASLVLGATGRTRHLAFLLDFDGTLVPIAKRPELARADAALRVMLDRLGSHPQVSVAVVSGRSREDLLAAMGGSVRASLFAEHGGVGVLPDGAVVFLTKPPNGDLLPVRHRVREVTWPEGVWVEEKDMALALHTRGAPRDGAARAGTMLRQIVGDVDRGQRLRVLEGKEILEVQPRGLHKGLVVEWLRRPQTGKSPLLVAIGDDRTDEDAFRSLAPGDFAIRVGHAGEPTAASFRLLDPPEVRWFLQGVLIRLPGPGFQGVCV